MTPKRNLRAYGWPLGSIPNFRASSRIVSCGPLHGDRGSFKSIMERAEDRSESFERSARDLHIILCIGGKAGQFLPRLLKHAPTCTIVLLFEPMLIKEPLILLEAEGYLTLVYTGFRGWGGVPGAMWGTFYIEEIKNF